MIGFDIKRLYSIHFFFFGVVAFFFGAAFLATFFGATFFGAAFLTTFLVTFFGATFLGAAFFATATLAISREKKIIRCWSKRFDGKFLTFQSLSEERKVSLLILLISSVSGFKIDHDKWSWASTDCHTWDLCIDRNSLSCPVAEAMKPPGNNCKLCYLPIEIIYQLLFKINYYLFKFLSAYKSIELNKIN